MLGINWSRTHKHDVEVVEKNETIFQISGYLHCFLATGCTSVFGVTGANDGRVVGEKWMEYDVIHLGLTITIIEPFSTDLMSISTVRKSSPSPLRHTIIFGKKCSPHTLEIVGKYQKALYVDGQSYGSTWYGSILIRDGVLITDEELTPAKKR
jgi:hypothetical protein